MQQIQQCGEVFCQSLIAPFFYQDTAQALCKNSITQYALSILAGVAIAISAGRAVQRVYSHLTPATSLLEAAKSGNLAAVKAAIAKKEDRNRQDPETGNTALHWAVLDKNDAVVYALLSGGSDRSNTEITNRLGQTPLNLACSQGTPTAIECLIQVCNNRDAKDLKGNTPMMLLAQRGLLQELEAVIVDPIVDLDAANNLGQTAKQLANPSMRTKIVKAIEAQRKMRKIQL